MSAHAETISNEIKMPVPDYFSVEAPSRSTLNPSLRGYVRQGWHLGPIYEESHPIAFGGFDLASAAREANFSACLPLNSVRRRAEGYSFDVLRRWLDRSFVTRACQDQTVTIHLTDSMTPTPELQPRETGADREFARSLGRLNYLRTLADGWLGEDSHGASEATGREAEVLLRRLHEEAPAAPLPVLGLDADGTIVMSWSGDGLTGSMTMHGDGTYSYFVRRHGVVASDAEAQVAHPIGPDLKRLLEA